MTTMRRMRVTLSGAGAVGGGVMTFYSLNDAASGWPAAVKALLSYKPLIFPDDLTFQVPNSGDVLNAETGALMGSWVDGPAQTPFSGANTANWASGVGIQIRWSTLAIVGRRRLVGSTFLVPTAGGIFDSDGTLATAEIAPLQTAIATYLAGTHNPAIWSRPKPAGRGKNGNLPAQAGIAAGIASGQVQDRTSWLRSRRT